MLRIFVVLALMFYSVKAEENKEVFLESISAVEDTDQLLTTHLGLKRFDLTVKLGAKRKSIYCSLVSHMYKGDGQYEKKVLLSNRIHDDLSAFDEFSFSFLLDENKVTNVYKLENGTFGVPSGAEVRKYKIRGKKLADYSSSSPNGFYKDGHYIFLRESTEREHYSFIALEFSEKRIKSFDKVDSSLAVVHQSILKEMEGLRALEGDFSFERSTITTELSTGEVAKAVHQMLKSSGKYILDGQCFLFNMHHTIPRETESFSAYNLSVLQAGKASGEFVVWSFGSSWSWSRSEEGQEWKSHPYFYVQKYLVKISPKGEKKYDVTWERGGVNRSAETIIVKLGEPLELIAPETLKYEKDGKKYSTEIKVFGKKSLNSLDKKYWGNPREKRLGNKSIVGSGKFIVDGWFLKSEGKDEVGEFLRITGVNPNLKNSLFRFSFYKDVDLIVETYSEERKSWEVASQKELKKLSSY